jgi:hypothetical protein
MYMCVELSRLRFRPIDVLILIYLIIGMFGHILQNMSRRRSVLYFCAPTGRFFALYFDTARRVIAPLLGCS